MRNKKKKVTILLISIVSIFLILILAYVIYKLYMSYYKPLEFQYEGSALGNYGYMETDITEEYVYNGWTGYFSVGKKGWDHYLDECVCAWHDFDFQPELDENEEYVCTYAYRLKTLEYSPWRRTPISKGYNNRATLWTDDYQEGVYYFYKIEKVNSVRLGNMDEYIYSTACAHIYDEEEGIEKTIKNLALVIAFMLLVCLLHDLYIPYRKLMFEYVGSASGKLSIIKSEPEEWEQEKYVYNTFEGYFSVRKKGWDFCVKECEWHDFDFQPELKEDEEYVCTYGYRLKTLEYLHKNKTKMSKGYYNRATLYKDDYQDGVYFFYKLKGKNDIHLGSMSEENERDCIEYDYYR